jgi:hypothetical protein
MIYVINPGNPDSDNKKGDRTSIYISALPDPKPNIRV